MRKNNIYSLRQAYICKIAHTILDKYYNKNSISLPRCLVIYCSEYTLSQEIKDDISSLFQFVESKFHSDFMNMQKIYHSTFNTDNAYHSAFNRHVERKLAYTKKLLKNLKDNMQAHISSLCEKENVK